MRREWANYIDDTPPVALWFATGGQVAAGAIGAPIAPRPRNATLVVIAGVDVQ